MEGLEGQGKDFVLDMGVLWKSVEGCEERHHMGQVAREVDYFGI